MRAAARSHTYAYVARRKLTSPTDMCSSGSFKYGGLRSLRYQMLGCRTIAIAHDTGANRVSAANDNGAVKSYGYDARGDATTVGAIHFGYDPANQPVSMSGAVNEKK